MHDILVAIIFSGIILMVLLVIIAAVKDLLSALFGISDKEPVNWMLTPNYDPNELGCSGCGYRTTLRSASCPQCGGPLQQFYAGHKIKEEPGK